MIINRARESSLIQILPLSPWLGRVRRLINNFHMIDFDHVFREQNVMADSLSKLALVAAPGHIFYELWSPTVLLGERARLLAFV